MAFSMNIVSTGLNTNSFVVPAAGTIFLDGKISLPTLVNGQGVSALIVTINQNGSPVYTGVAGAEGFYKSIACAANDAIAIVLSSANAVDAVPNAVKMTVAVGDGI